MSKLRLLIIALVLGGVLCIGGCASTYHSAPAGSPPEKTSDKIDKDKVFKKDEDSDDMERLD